LGIGSLGVDESVTYRSTRFGMMFLCFDVAGVLGGLLELLALCFLGCELASHGAMGFDLKIFGSGFFVVYEFDVLVYVYFSSAEVSQNAGTYPLLVWTCWW
jgi:hypothetical protein